MASGKHGANQIFLENRRAAGERRGEAPVEYRRLPFDEGFVMENQCHSTEYRDDDEAYPEHGVYLAVSEPRPADLSKGGYNGYNGRDIYGFAGSRVTAAQLERNEEKDDREKIEEEFHGAASEKIGRLWPIINCAVHVPAL